MNVPKKASPAPVGSISFEIVFNFLEIRLLLYIKSAPDFPLVTINKFKSLANEQIDKRDSLNHSIDGLVLTIVNKDIQKLLGRTNSINKYQIAYKFPEQGSKTIVRDMLITTGNFGYKEILLIVDPVILNGTTQSKAQVHSLNKFNKMKLRIGDEIILKLSGDVIPYGYKDSTCEPGDGKKLKLPSSAAAEGRAAQSRT